VSGRRRLTTIALAVGVVVACDRLPDERAANLVRTYNDRVAAAYRAADPQLVDGVVGPEEAGKLAELIRLKDQRGIWLDARLQQLEVRRVDRPSRTRVVVETDERWLYVDRQVASGDPVADAVDERYEMRYVLEPVAGVWVVTRVEFVDAPG
jgi:hypothetical protein